MSEAGCFEEIIQKVENGEITVQELVKLITASYVNENITKEVFLFGINYCKLLDKATEAKRENKLIDIEELINCGLFDSTEEVFKMIKKHSLEDMLRHNSVISPEPTEEEKNQIYDSEDSSKVCVTCTHRKRHVVNIPCGHTAMCSVCSEKYVESKKKSEIVECIICKKEIKSVNRLYLA